MNPQLPPASAAAQRLREIFAESGLVPSERVAKGFDGWNGDPAALERSFVEDASLTHFQFAALMEGRGESLRVGNYDLLDRLGAGGMGTVFKARHRRMKRIVALKVLSSKLSENPVFVKRFQREVETIACLGHPNVVMAYDADEAEIGHFLVMEYVDGVDLAGAVKQGGPFSVARAVNCILQVARGLAYAHEQGIIHRDIKPHNLLQDRSGTIKITDLGLARLNHGGEGVAEGAEVTMAGGVIGTPDYMPPEQGFDSTTVDHRADIYSLGCTLHFLLTGKSPYDGTSVMQILLRHRESPIPSLSAGSPETPPQLDDLFRRMLAKEPTDRIQHMAEVAAELEAIESILDGFDPTAGSANATVELPPEHSLGESRSGAATSQIADLTTAVASGASPLTVLLVEPSRVQASIVRNYLEEKSHAVVATATKAVEVLAEFRQRRPQAIVSALYLPDGDGAELARKIVSEAGELPPGFVLITSESDGASSISLGDLPSARLLHKPFSASELDEALRQAVRSANAGRGAAAPSRPDRGAAKVLIVDDSGTARRHVRNVLEGLGFSRFVDAPDGADAIAQAAGERFDLIVTDYNMPLMDGRALISYLKQNPATAAVPIIMVTSETDPASLDAVRKLGVLAVLDKAFRVEQVRPLLNSRF